MKVYYYTCPRCGRVWKKYFPHPVMQCKFCDETWRTAGRKGTKSRFSLSATLLWLIAGLAVVFIAWKTVAFFGVSVSGPKNNPAVIVAPPEIVDGEASDDSLGRARTEAEDSDADSGGAVESRATN